MTLLNAFNLPEDSITADNYETALQHLNSSHPHVVLGLNVEKCEMQKLLSEVTLSDSSECPHICRVTHMEFVAGSGGNRSGLHRLYRSHYQDAWIPNLVRALLCHAPLLRNLYPVWQH